MSTRSVIAEPWGDTWRGRYCHADGYATWNGRHLWALVQRDGLARVVDTLIHQHYGWSCIAPGTPSLKGVRADVNAPYGSAPYTKYQFSKKGMHGDGRFANVVGYGTAYTDTVLSMPGHEGAYQQVKADDWHSPENLDCFIEWVYVLTPGGMLFGPTAPNGKVRIEKRWDGSPFESPCYSLSPVGLFPWAESEPDWQGIEDALNNNNKETE